MTGGSHGIVTMASSSRSGEAGQSNAGQPHKRVDQAANTRGRSKQRRHKIKLE
jgi:hypothetical protein